MHYKITFWSLRSISKINILNCIVYLARKERWHVIKIRALVMCKLFLIVNYAERSWQATASIIYKVKYVGKQCALRHSCSIKEPLFPPLLVYEVMQLREEIWWQKMTYFFVATWVRLHLFEIPLREDGDLSWSLEIVSFRVHLELSKQTIFYVKTLLFGILYCIVLCIWT